MDSSSGIAATILDRCDIYGSDCAMWATSVSDLELSLDQATR